MNITIREQIDFKSILIISEVYYENVNNEFQKSIKINDNKYFVISQSGHFVYSYFNIDKRFFSFTKFNYYKILLKFVKIT